jgi:uncharacterized protein (DUF1778 family)
MTAIIYDKRVIQMMQSQIKSIQQHLDQPFKKNIEHIRLNAQAIRDNLESGIEL